MSSIAPTHCSKEVNGVLWHWVEMGTGDPVVLLHGIPESWYCWHHQMPTLATQFRVISVDLKGYGQSDKRDGDYSGPNVARELIALLDAIGVKTFRLAGHDWGVMICDHICDQVPERVERYARLCLSLHEYDIRNSLHHQWNAANPDAATRLMKNPEAYIRVWFDSSCKPETRPDDDEIRAIAAEFAHPGIAEAVPRYFRDLRKSKAIDVRKMTMPVLYIQGEHDPRQPIEYARGMEEHVPGLEAIMILDCGHFVTHERPREVTQALMWFYHSMLGPGVPLFDRSRHYGLPTRPVKPREGFGVNAMKK